ncbi:MAG: hypothetical protein ACLPPF_17270 [Rhodomicrobium sp.]
MTKELVTSAEARRHIYAGWVPLFDQIAQGFLEAVAGRQKSGLFAVLNYLDGALVIDGASYTRRAVVLAMLDLKQHMEAPLTLQTDARAQMSMLELSPIPELKLYGDIATVILRMDSVLRHSMRIRAHDALDRGHVFH